MSIQMPFGFWVSTVLSKSCKHNKSSLKPSQWNFWWISNSRLVTVVLPYLCVDPPIWTRSGPMSKTPTIRAMKARIVLKLRRPILQEPSTSSTMSACAVVRHITSDRGEIYVSWSSRGLHFKLHLIQQLWTQNAVSSEMYWWRRCARERKR